MKNKFVSKQNVSYGFSLPKQTTNATSRHKTRFIKSSFFSVFVDADVTKRYELISS